MSVGVVSWWAFLSAVAVINIMAWLFAAATLRRRRAGTRAGAFSAGRLQLLLSGVYVAGCAFRSFLPVYDIPRLCLVDSWLSSVLVGRSVATLAELCFAAQWALLLHASARAAGSDTVRKVSLAIVPLIAIAEVFSWYAVLTTWNLGHVVENSLWGLSAALLVAGMLSIGPRFLANRMPLFAAWCVGGAAYVAFMFLVDVPMYWSRWIADEVNGRNYLSVAQGVLDASACRLVSFDWEDWKNEVTWMTLYFSVGVWVSISLIHASVPRAVDSRAAA
jgi:hypothetical protein